MWNNVSVNKTTQSSCLNRHFFPFVTVPWLKQYPWSTVSFSFRLVCQQAPFQGYLYRYQTLSTVNERKPLQDHWPCAASANSWSGQEASSHRTVVVEYSTRVTALTEDTLHCRCVSYLICGAYFADSERSMIEWSPLPRHAAELVPAVLRFELFQVSNPFYLPTGWDFTLSKRSLFLLCSD